MSGCMGGRCSCQNGLGANGEVMMVCCRCKIMAGCGAEMGKVSPICAPAILLKQDDYSGQASITVRKLGKVVVYNSRENPEAPILCPPWNVTPLCFAS